MINFKTFPLNQQSNVDTEMMVWKGLEKVHTYMIYIIYIYIHVFVFVFYFLS